MNFLESFEDATRPDIPKKPWFDEVSMGLVDSIEMLNRVVDECIETGRYGLDLETTGLDNRVFDGETKDKIVGFCLAPDGKRGYYAPLRHQKGEEHNLPIQAAYACIRRLVEADSVAVFHNAKFDHEFLQFPGGEGIGMWDDPKTFDDTNLLGWLRNTRDKNLNLKHMSANELGKEMVELEDLFGKDHQDKLDFSELDPSWEPCIWYTCSDAICTLLLYEKVHPEVVAPDGKRSLGQEVIYNLEKMTLPATRWMERARLWVDQERVAELMQLGQVELFQAMCDIYDFCNEALGSKRPLDRDEHGNTHPGTVEPGWFRVLRKKFVPDNPDYDINKQIEDCRQEAKRKNMDDLDAKGHYFKLDVPEGDPDHGSPQKYDILSRQQLGPLFEELRIPDLNRTAKSDQVQTTQAEIEWLDEKHGHKYPFLPKIKRLGELQKALGTYLISLHRDVGPDGTLRANYKQMGTDTGRFTTPSSKNPEEDGGTKFPIHGAPATYDKKRPQCLLGIRSAFRARPGRTMVAIDCGGVELRIATIYSGEPKWLREYFRCSSCGNEFEAGDGTITPEAPPAYCPKCGDDRIGDLHTLTGITFFGEDKVGTKQWKQMRQEAKCVHPDTLVLTPSGLERIGAKFEFGKRDEFLDVENPEDAAIWNGDAMQPVKASYNGGSKKLFHVVTHRGIVTCSDKHRFKLKNGRLMSIEKGLAEGVGLVLPNVPRMPVFRGWKQIQYRAGEDVPPTYIALGPDLAYFAGVYLGDGMKRGGWSVGISHGHVEKTDKMGIPYAEWQDHLVALCEELQFRPVRRKQSVYLGSRKVIGFLGALGLVGDDEKRRLRVPDWVLQGGQLSALQFLGGLIDTDGTVDKEDAEIAITTKDAVFGGQLMALLRALGFMPRMEPCWNKTYKRWYYRLHIRASEALRLKDVIRHRGKVDRLRKAKLGTKEPENQVLAIIPAGRQPCVDVSMKGREHLYWCNGLITHNSVNFAMAYGGGPSAIIRVIKGCSEQEAARHHRSFNEAYSTLKNWWDEVKTFGRKRGYVTTAFGRHYPIPDILLPTKFGKVKQQLLDEYPEKLARWEKKYEAARTPKQQAHLLEIKPAPPTDAAVKKQMEINRKFKAKAERNATNGPIQGLSADITKLAMALIYRECKKRGWFEKVYMIITIHDELVFEVEDDILADAVETFQRIMTRNKTILNMKWPVPLTTDCEVGFDWTVPWDIKDFKYRRVRPDGFQTDEKGRLFRDKETGELKAKRWPEKFVKIFGPAYGFAPVVENLTEEEGRKFFGAEWKPLTEAPTEPTAPVQAPGPSPAPQTAQETPETAQKAPQAVPAEEMSEEAASTPNSPAAPSKAPAAPTTSHRPSASTLKQGEVFEYRLRELGIGVADKLAHVIVHCRGRGSHPLRIVGPSGERLPWPDASIMVNDVEFLHIAGHYGI
jgi:DNA polymerase I-like protein with 3'-5' exonuclease and polymerase domains